MGLGLLGAVALAEGNHEEARTRCEASLDVWQQSSGHPSEFEGELACLALAAWGLGNRNEAREHLRGPAGRLSDDVHVGRFREDHQVGAESGRGAAELLP